MQTFPVSTVVITDAPEPQGELISKLMQAQNQLEQMIALVAEMEKAIGQSGATFYHKRNAYAQLGRTLKSLVTLGMVLRKLEEPAKPMPDI